MAQRTYCINAQCAKPIEYAYAKPNFCPHCGNPLSAVLARPVTASPAPLPASYTPARASRDYAPQPTFNPALASVQRRMEARRNRADEEEEDDDDYEESNAHYDFSNFQFNASVTVPKQPKMTLGDFVAKENK
jgi:hypothetical protein